MNNSVKHDLWAGFVGLIFGFGLIVSDMVSPDRVLGFLDFFGNWDPSLAFVMIGGILVTFIGFRILKGKEAPLFNNTFHWPTKDDIDKRLIAGAAIFGIGWGLAGICPGPAFAGFFANPQWIAIFMVSMLVGGVATARLIKK